MSLTFVLEHRLAQTPDGACWTSTLYARAFWDRYCDVFDEVRIVSRVRQADRPSDNWRRVDGPGVTVHPVPHYVGPLEYAMRHRAVRRAIDAAMLTVGPVIFRVPSQLATVAASAVKARGRHYALEVVGDPDAAFGAGALRHPLRSLFRRWYTTQMRRQCLSANAVLYVSEGLSRAYPSHAGASVVVCSDAELSDAAFVSAPRRHRKSNALRLIYVGSLEQPVKGVSVLIDACERLVHTPVDVALTIIGDGRLRREFEQQVDDAGLGQRVRFLGTLPAGAAVRERMDEALMFVLPSWTEGMPRALIEAMARGLPCVGSAVGGIRELLSAEDTVPPGDAAALARLIVMSAGDPDRLDRMSARNLERARLFVDSVLDARRRGWLESIRDDRSRGVPSNRQVRVDDDDCGRGE